MDDSPALLPFDAGRWQVRCPACRTALAVSLGPKTRPHVHFQCPRCKHLFWAVNWWQRVEAVNRWRETPGRSAGDHDLAVLAMLGCAAEYLRTLPFDGCAHQVRIFERAFEASDTAHGLACLAAFAQDQVFAPLPAAAPEAPAPPPRRSTAAKDTDALPALTDGRAHSRCPVCSESTTVTPAEAAAGEGIAMCDCGHRWVWSPKGELAGILERVASLQGRGIPLAHQRLRQLLEPTLLPVSRLTRGFAEAAARDTDLAAMHQALRLLAIERYPGHYPA